MELEISSGSIISSNILTNERGTRYSVYTCFIHDITESSSSNWRSEILACPLKRIAISTERHRVCSLKMRPPRFESGDGNRKSSIARTSCDYVGDTRSLIMPSSA